MTILYFVGTIILIGLHIVGHNATEIEIPEEGSLEPPSIFKSYPRFSQLS